MGLQRGRGGHGRAVDVAPTEAAQDERRWWDGEGVEREREKPRLRLFSFPHVQPFFFPPSLDSSSFLDDDFYFWGP